MSSGLALALTNHGTKHNLTFCSLFFSFLLSPLLFTRYKSLLISHSFPHSSLLSFAPEFLHRLLPRLNFIFYPPPPLPHLNPVWRFPLFSLLSTLFPHSLTSPCRPPSSVWHLLFKILTHLLFFSPFSPSLPTTLTKCLECSGCVWSSSSLVTASIQKQTHTEQALTFCHWGPSRSYDDRSVPARRGPR